MPFFRVTITATPTDESREAGAPDDVLTETVTVEADTVEAAEWRAMMHAAIRPLGHELAYATAPA